MTLPLRPELVGLEPYGAPQLEVAARLNVNENPYPPPAGVVDAISAAVHKAAEGLNRYPDRDFLALRIDLANYLAGESRVDFLEPKNIWAANGSNEVMLHLHQAFGGPGHRVLSFAPTYSMYPEYARDTITDFVTLPRRDDFTLDLDAATAAIADLAPSMVIVASPNNPTGTALSLDEVRQLADAAAAVPAGCVLVVDEAYAEFRRSGVPSAATIIPEYPNLGRLPHHVKGICPGRRPVGLPCRARACHRCAPRGAASVPPQRRDPGDRTSGPRAPRRTASAGSRDSSGT